MDTAYYVFDKNHKEDTEFLMVVYKFCRDNYIIPASNKYGVVGCSVMTITQAVQNVTKYQLKYNNKKYRPWCMYKEEILNKYSDNNNLIYIDMPAYLHDENDEIVNLKKYNKVIKCTDNSFSTYMYKNNNERKNTLKDADVYFISGNSLLGKTYQIKQKIKLSVAFFTDEKLAIQVQKNINYITAGFIYKSIKYFENKISNGDRLLSIYEKINKKMTKDINNIKKIVKDYNNKNKNKKVNFIREPSNKYLYITSKYKNNIIKFIEHYKKSTSEYELNKCLIPNIYTPEVNHGIYIQLNALK